VCSSQVPGDDSGLVNRDTRGLYFVNIGIGVDTVRMRQVLATLRQRFGQPAARVFYLLLLEGQLEQKAVAAAAMVSKETAREALYNMLRAG